MKILIACEFTDTVGREFRARGHDVTSCDLLPSEGRGNHVVGDVRWELRKQWDMIIAFPPCDHLSLSGARWWKKKRLDGRQRMAIDFFMLFVSHPCGRICIENPVGIMSSNYRVAPWRSWSLQYVQPYWFGDSLQKKTCLFLKGLPPLMATGIVDRGEIYVTKAGKKRGSAHYMLMPHKDRAKNRSRFHVGMAKAMAVQWPGKS